MTEKIKELEEIKEYLDTLLWLLKGESSERHFTYDGTIEKEIDCYSSLGEDFNLTFSEIIEEHGSERLPTAD